MSGTVSLVWEVIRGSAGPVGQSLRVHAGPTLQRRRAEQLRFLGAVSSETELLNTIRDAPADNVYLTESEQHPGTTLVLLSDDRNQTNWGITVGATYGVHYGPVAARVGIMGRKVTNVDGFSFGVGAGLTVSL